MAKICPNCGNNAADNEKFCTACGTKLPEAAPADEPAAPVGQVAEEPSVTDEPKAVEETAAVADKDSQPFDSVPLVDYSAVNKGRPVYGNPDIPQQMPDRRNDTVQNGAVQYGAPQYPNAQNNAPQYGAAQYPNAQNNAPQYGAPQYPNAQNNAPQYGNPQYGNPQYGYPQYASPAPKKKNTVLIVAVIVGAIVLFVGIITILISSLAPKIIGSGGNTGIVSTVHDLDGEYRLTGLTVAGQDYSSLLSFVSEDYHVTIKGSECSLVMDDHVLTITIDQANRKLISSSTDEEIEFSVSGNTITIGLEGVQMVFTKE